MAASSTSSCSPPEVRHYNLRSKRRQTIPAGAISSCSPPEARHYNLRSKRRQTIPAGAISSCSPPEARHYNLWSKRWQTIPAGAISSKRSSMDHSVCSPRTKKSSKTTSLDDCLEDLDDLIKDSRRNKSSLDLENEEGDKVFQILKEDGFSESDSYFAQALCLCENRARRYIFLNHLKIKEVWMKYVKFSWDVMLLQSK